MTSETAKKNTLEQARTEKVYPRGPFLSVGASRSLLALVDQQQDRTVPWAHQPISLARSVIPRDDRVGSDALFVLDEGRREPQNKIGGNVFEPAARQPAGH